MIVVASAAAGFAVRSGATPKATCTYEQKQARATALAAYRRTLVGKRPNSAQRKKLARLRTAAACTVPPLPASSSASCSPSLAFNRQYLESRAQGQPYPSFLGNEGPTHPGDFLRSLGHVRLLVLSLDFPNLPGDASAAAAARVFFPEPEFFAEMSYGRFTIETDTIDRWIRMPSPHTAYAPISEHVLEYIRDAVAAADPFVDFTRFDFVFLIPTLKFLSGTTSQAIVRYPGRGFAADGTEMRFFATIQPDAYRFGRGTRFTATHEFLHALSLPDTRNSPEPAGVWDPMGDGPTGWPPPVHLLGWHKWKLGWLDPSQLTCVTSAVTAEETITRLASPGGKKLVVVPLSATTAYVVEARTRYGYDTNTCEEGVLVYTVDSRLSLGGPFPDGYGVVNLKGPKRCGTVTAGAFRTGQTFEDGFVKVEVLARNATSFRVRVTKK